MEAINLGRFVPLKEGDYEFSWSYVDGQPIAKRSKPPGEPLAFQYLRASPTFRPEFEAGTHGGYYQPRKVIVLCDAGTLSAGFSVVVTFHRLGATLVGTPTAQAPNSYGAAAVWKLKHTGIRGMVPMIAATHFPFEPAKAHVLPVDFPLTYERLASYRFDPNSEYLYALRSTETPRSSKLRPTARRAIARRRSNFTLRVPHFGPPGLRCALPGARAKAKSPRPTVGTE